MTDQPEALRLADALEANNGRRISAVTAQHSADLLRAQHAEIELLRAERKEDEGVIAVWRGRTQRAEAEIERLREALRSIAGNGCCDRCQEAALVARSALKKGERLPTPPEECQTESEKKAFAFGYWSGVAAIRARGEKP